MEGLEFDALYEAHSAMVYWTAYGLLSNHDSALEVTQTVFMKAYEQWDKLNRLAPFQAKSWLFKSARNAAIDRLRKEKRETISDALPDFMDSDEASSPEPALMNAEREREVWTLMQALPALYRAPILLHYFAGLSQAEAAAALRVSGGTYRSRLSRGKAMLERIIEKKEAEHHA